MKKFSIKIRLDVSSISPEMELELLWKLNDRLTSLLPDRATATIVCRYSDLEDVEKGFRSFKTARKKFSELQTTDPARYSFGLVTMGGGTSTLIHLYRDEDPRQVQTGFTINFESSSVDVVGFGTNLFQELVIQLCPLSASFEGFKEHLRPAQLYCPEGFVWKLCDGLVLDSVVVGKLGGEAVLGSLATSVDRFTAGGSPRFLVFFDWSRRSKELEAVLRPLLAAEVAVKPESVELTVLGDDYDADQDPDAYQEFLEEWSEEEPVQRLKSLDSDGLN